MTDTYKSQNVNRIQCDLYDDHMIISITLYKGRSVVTIICTQLFPDIWKVMDIPPREWHIMT